MFARDCGEGFNLSFLSGVIHGVVGLGAESMYLQEHACLKQS